MLRFTEKQVTLNGSTSIVDFELDSFSNLQLEFTLSKPASIEVALGEVLAPDGRIHRTPGGYRTIRIMNKKCPKGKSCFPFELKMHQTPYPGKPTVSLPEEAQGEIIPFRYVEITGGREGDKATLRRREVYGPWSDSDAFFTSSDERLNSLWMFCKHTMKATSAFGIFIDGERERLPYEGDTYINQLGYFCCSQDTSVPRRTIDWLLKTPTWPTEWRLIMPLIVRDYILYTGDKQNLAEWLPGLMEGLLPRRAGSDGLLYPVPRQAENSSDIIDWPPSERDEYEFGDVNLVPNCYYFGALRTMAELTGKNQYRDMAIRVKKSIYEQMFDSATGLFVDSPGSKHTALHSVFFPLFFDLAKDPEPLKKVILSHKLDCSVYGAQFLIDVCFRYGLDEHAISLMTVGGLRSWQNMLKKGATITMEAWDDSLKPNQDWNHAWGAAPANIIPRFIAGIRPVAPGFAKFVVDPHPGKLSSFNLRHPTPHGEIQITQEQQKKLHLKVPEGTVAVYRGREYGQGEHQL